MTSAVPTVGRIVHYALAAIDCQLISNGRRPIDGHAVEAIGNKPDTGDVCAAIVVRAFPGTQVVNLQVFLDGNDTYWVTSVAEGDGAGFWHWPPRV